MNPWSWRIYPVVLAVLVATVLGCRRPPPLRRDPLAWVPPSARVVLWVDMVRLRRSPALARWLDRPASPSERCEVRLGRRVRSLAVLVPRLPVDDFALVVAGDLSQDEVLRCADTRPDARYRVQSERRLGRDLVRLVLRPGVTSSSRAEVVLVPGGPVLLGPAALLAPMLDRGLSAQAPEGAVVTLGRRMGPGLALWVATQVGPGDLDLGTGVFEASLRHVRSAALGFRVDQGLEAMARLVCDGPAGATQVARTLETLREGRGEVEAGPLVRVFLQAATVQVQGGEVALRASLEPRQLEGLLQALEVLAGTEATGTRR